MPIYCYKCTNGHTIERYKHKPQRRFRRSKCKKCGMWLNRDIQAEHSKRGQDIHLSYTEEPISHLVKKRSFKGISIENITPEPVFVRNSAQYDKLLKSTHSREKNTGYAGR